MSASVKIILHNKKYSDGTQAVMLQCIASTTIGTIWKRRTLCKVKAMQFDKKTCRVVKHPNLLVLDVQIADAFNEAEKKLTNAQIDGRKIDPAYIIATTVATPNQEAFLLQHGKTYVERCRKKGQFHTAEKYGGHITRLAEYLGRDKVGQQIDVHMDDVTEDWILAWSVWLQSHGTNSPNTLHRRMAFITTLFNDARKRGLTSANPMAVLEFKEQRVRKPKLTAEQLVLLEEMHLTGSENDARNTFMLQFYAYGTRISDALTWKKTDIRKEGDVWYLAYTSMQTGTLLDIRLSEKAKVVIQQYLDRVPGKFLLPWLAKFEAIPGKSDNENHGRLIEQIESKTQIVNVLLKKVVFIGKNIRTYELDVSYEQNWSLHKMCL